MNKTSSWTFKVSHLMDKDQVRVGETEPGQYFIKCGKQLTFREQLGALVKYELAKEENRRLESGKR